MNRKRLTWLVVLVVFAISAVGLKVWRNHVENSFDTIRSPDESAAWMKAAQAETSGNIVVAVGSFDHPNVNNRDTNFPGALAKYLIALKKPKLTFVQRKLSEKPSPAAANWVLNGSYDTYAAGKARVYLTLMRVRGGHKSTNIDGSLGTDLNVKIAQAANEMAVTPDPALARYSGKMTEAQVHLERGRELAGFEPQYRFFSNPMAPYLQILSDDEIARQGFRFDQAIRSLEASLALDPDRTETKVLLGACYETPVVHRWREARALYQDVIDKAREEKWRHIAKVRLVFTWHGEDNEKALALLSQFTKEARTPEQAEWFRERAEFFKGATGNEDYSVRKLKTVAALDDFEKRLANPKTKLISLNNGPHMVFASMTNKAARAEKTLAFIEGLKPKYPLLAPYMIRDATVYGLTEQPVMKQAFAAMIGELKLAPEKVARPDIFYAGFEDTPLQFFDSDEDMGASAIEVMEAAHAKGLCDGLTDRLKIAKAFQLMKHEKWSEAADTFASVGPRMIAMGHGGPWGCAVDCPTSPMAWADRCRLSLGLGPARPEFHRELNKAIFESKYPPLIAQDGATIWVADTEQLLQFDDAGKQLQKVAFRAPRPISALAVVNDTLYIGTEGAGLIRLAKESLHTVKYHSVESLLSEHITALKVVGDALWIGYGHQKMDRQKHWGRVQISGRSDFGKDASGGVGMLDLRTSAFTDYAFTRAASAESIEVNRDWPVTENEQRRFDNLPPNRPVLEIAAAENGAVYVATDERGLQRFEPAQNKWTTFRNNPECPLTSVVRSDEYLCVGQLDGRVANSVHRGKSLWIRRAGQDAFKFFTTKEGLPHENVTALFLDKDALWVGGFGYVAQLNLTDMKITRVFSLPASEITRIIAIADNVWMASEDSVYTTRL